ncbi:MAG: SRPBCC family protein [Iamia sp.]
MHVRSDRRWSFPATPERFWDVVASVDEYPTWWPWLRRFEADALATGARWKCTVSPPLPYRIRFDLRMEEVDRPWLARVSVTGDIRGSARMDVTPVDGGCQVRLRSDLVPAHPSLRVASAVTRPMIRWGHDWVLDTGVRQLRSRAL